MKELSKEVFDYIKNNNGVDDNLFNGVLLEVYLGLNENDIKTMTLSNLISITDKVIDNTWFVETLRDCISISKENY